MTSINKNTFKTIKSKNVKLTIDQPGENYDHPRFDWTGKIIDVKFKGISLAGYEKDDPQPGEYIGRGFYNEFGIEKAVGFNECEVGGWFHKIGVGLLQKEWEEYTFYQPYRIKPSAFSVIKEVDSILILSETPIVNGYGYRYKKKVNVSKSGFEIQYALENTGEKNIVTDEYNHNFIQFGSDSIGASYQIKFPLILNPKEFGEALNPHNVVNIKEDKVSFKETPESPLFFSYLNGNASVQANWEIVNNRLGIGISEIGSFNTQKINLWGWRGAISPELFIEVNIKPGASQSWSRKYKIFEL